MSLEQIINTEMRRLSQSMRSYLVFIHETTTDLDTAGIAKLELRETVLAQHPEAVFLNDMSESDQRAIVSRWVANCIGVTLDPTHFALAGRHKAPDHQPRHRSPRPSHDN